MKLTEMTDEELFKVSLMKVTRGPTKGNYTSEAKRAAGILRARHNSFVDCGFGNCPRDTKIFNGDVIIIKEGTKKA